MSSSTPRDWTKLILTKEDTALLRGAALTARPAEAQAGKLLAALRKLSNLHPDQAAQKCGMTEAEYLRCEQHNISFFSLEKIIRGLELKRDRANYLVQVWSRHPQHEDHLLDALKLVPGSDRAPVARRPVSLPAENYDDYMALLNRNAALIDKPEEAQASRLLKALRQEAGFSAADAAEACNMTEAEYRACEESRISLKQLGQIIGGLDLKKARANYLVQTWARHPAHEDQVLEALHLVPGFELKPFAPPMDLSKLHWIGDGKPVTGHGPTKAPVVPEALPADDEHRKAAAISPPPASKAVPAQKPALPSAEELARQDIRTLIAGLRGKRAYREAARTCGVSTFQFQEWESTGIIHPRHIQRIITGFQLPPDAVLALIDVCQRSYAGKRALIRAFETVQQALSDMVRRRLPRPEDKPPLLAGVPLDPEQERLNSQRQEMAEKLEHIRHGRSIDDVALRIGVAPDTYRQWKETGAIPVEGIRNIIVHLRPPIQEARHLVELFCLMRPNDSAGMVMLGEALHLLSQPVTKASVEPTAPAAPASPPVVPAEVTQPAARSQPAPKQPPAPADDLPFPLLPPATRGRIVRGLGQAIRDLHKGRSTAEAAHICDIAESIFSGWEHSGYVPPDQVQHLIGRLKPSQEQAATFKALCRKRYTLEQRAEFDALQHAGAAQTGTFPAKQQLLHELAAMAREFIGMRDDPMEIARACHMSTRALSQWKEIGFVEPRHVEPIITGLNVAPEAADRFRDTCRRLFLQDAKLMIAFELVQQASTPGITAPSDHSPPAEPPPAKTPEPREPKPPKRPSAKAVRKQLQKEIAGMFEDFCGALSTDEVATRCDVAPGAVKMWQDGYIHPTRVRRVIERLQVPADKAAIFREKCRQLYTDPTQLAEFDADQKVIASAQDAPPSNGRGVNILDTALPAGATKPPIKLDAATMRKKAAKEAKDKVAVLLADFMHNAGYLTPLTAVQDCGISENQPEVARQWHQGIISPQHVQRIIQGFHLDAKETAELVEACNDVYRLTGEFRMKAITVEKGAVHITKNGRNPAVEKLLAPSGPSRSDS